MGRITLPTIFLSAEGERIMEKQSQVREKMMSRVDEW